MWFQLCADTHKKPVIHIINHFTIEHSFLIRFIKLLLVFKHQDLQMFVFNFNKYE